MAELSRPADYMGKLLFVQRLAKAAQYRTDPKLAVRELCEALGELTTALIERERGKGCETAGPTGQEP